MTWSDVNHDPKQHIGTNQTTPQSCTTPFPPTRRKFYINCIFLLPFSMKTIPNPSKVPRRWQYNQYLTRKFTRSSKKLTDSYNRLFVLSHKNTFPYINFLLIIFFSNEIYTIDNQRFFLQHTLHYFNTTQTIMCVKPLKTIIWRSPQTSRINMNFLIGVRFYHIISWIFEK